MLPVDHTIVALVFWGLWGGFAKVQALQVMTRCELISAVYKPEFTPRMRYRRRHNPPAAVLPQVTHSLVGASTKTGRDWRSLRGERGQRCMLAQTALASSQSPSSSDIPASSTGQCREMRGVGTGRGGEEKGQGEGHIQETELAIAYALATLRGGGLGTSGNGVNGFEKGFNDGFKATGDSNSGSPAAKGPPPLLALDVVESFASRLYEILKPLLYAIHFLFGMSLLFYGVAFQTFAFHIIVFRLSGYKQVVSSFQELAKEYSTTRKSISDATEGLETVGDRVASGDKLKEARESMTQTKRQMLSDGILTADETEDFMNQYRSELEEIIDEQTTFASARSSILALYKSVNLTHLRNSVTAVYSSVITAFTASTVKEAGIVTLGLHIGGLLKCHILDMFGPIIDPIGYGLDLDSYYESKGVPYLGKGNAMGGPSNMALNILCYGSVFLMLHSKPDLALKAAVIYYGARVVTDYMVKAANSFQRQQGLKNVSHTPWSASVHLLLTILGAVYHRNCLTSDLLEPGVWSPSRIGSGVIGLIEPFSRLLVACSKVLNDQNFTTINYIQSEQVEEAAKVVEEAVAMAAKAVPWAG
ncbi:unnamed protein product [Discosporangium mesarthrocarpum]